MNVAVDYSTSYFHYNFGFLDKNHLKTNGSVALLLLENTRKSKIEKKIKQN